MATQRLRRKLDRDGVPEHVNLGENFVSIGTPLPALNANRKDKNEFKPVWQQEVYDSKGRRRFHGAFTGGFSAGYFNTVGSKEGWTPSTFHSSRSSRAGKVERRPEDYMDEDDLAELDQASTLRAKEGYTDDAKQHTDPMLGMIAPAKSQTSASPSSMGVMLLQRMGWKQGQGIGPLLTYKGREKLNALLQSLHLAPAHVQLMDVPVEAHNHKFPPPDTQLIKLPDNRDHRGLGALVGHGSSELQGVLAKFHSTKRPERTIGMSGMDSDDEDHVYGAPDRIEDSVLGRHEQMQIGGGTVPDKDMSIENYEHAFLTRKSISDATWHDGRPLPKGDTAKHARYKTYLHANMNQTLYKPDMSVHPTELLLQTELDEFFEMASRYRPIQGEMASRFTTSVAMESDPNLEGGLYIPSKNTQPPTIPKVPELKPEPDVKKDLTSAQQAAQKGEFGPLTRSLEPFHPPRLLCKRFGVPNPYPNDDTPQDDIAKAMDRFGQTYTTNDEDAFTFIHSEAAERADEDALQHVRPTLNLFKAVFESDEEEVVPSAPKRKSEKTRVKKKTKNYKMGPLTFNMDEDEATM
ncbi:hypothetical protein MVES1_000098 [Malassezia vespertilionis]|uniref:G-patch domain-containing protein n=1 Tax=Malassezia vespertilionis TaxID=2020962 RepID=A0A2N1JHK9_9BASI|nr:uncharacterized protein MVES1_000098 [Malassezia vespertilionis]PKI86018.1 hypothetical protein MVES_000098 [Malassezia vespertilionis]WFD04774.1 hypothetical protein MVES1_000098 [Malassezia vespertilionis]